MKRENGYAGVELIVRVFFIALFILAAWYIFKAPTSSGTTQPKYSQLAEELDRGDYAREVTRLEEEIKFYQRQLQGPIDPATVAGLNTTLGDLRQELDKARYCLEEPEKCFLENFEK